MKKIFSITVLIGFFSLSAMAQVSVVNADSVRLGNPVGSGGVSLHGKTYLKNISAGSLSDSVLVRDGSGQIRFVKRSAFANFQDASSSVKGMIKLAGDLGGTADFPLVLGKQAQLNGTGFVMANGTNISYDNSSYELAFSKLTAFNKNFGTTAGTVMEGNDSRIVNGQTAFGWGNHASAGYALANGSNASGTWGINITGNAASATNWGAATTFSTTGMDANLQVMMGYNWTTSNWTYYTVPSVRSWLGLGSAAYLNADVSATDNTVVQRSGSGLAMITGGYLKTTLAAVDATTPTDIVTTAGDGVLRRNSAGAIRSFLGIPGSGDNLQSVTDRGSTTTNQLSVTGGEQRMVSSYLPTSYTTGDIVSGHSYKWYSDTWTIGNTRSSASPSEGFGFSFNGTSLAKLFASGNFGLGYATDQGYKLAVNGSAFVNGTLSLGGSFFAGSSVDKGYYQDTSNGAYRALSSSGNRGYYFQSYNGTNTTMYVGLTGDYAGNVGIGYTDPTHKLAVNGAGYFSGAILADGYVQGNNLQIKETNPYIQWLNTSGTRLGYIQATGGNLALSADGGGKFLIGNNTEITGTVTSSGGFFNSDIRLKNLIKYSYNKQAISDLKPITYKWKDKRDDKKHIGYSAQEVEKVLPDAISTDDKGIKSVNYIEVLVAKIEALEKSNKELQEQINELKKNKN